MQFTDLFSLPFPLMYWFKSVPSISLVIFFCTQHICNVHLQWRRTLLQYIFIELLSKRRNSPYGEFFSPPPVSPHRVLPIGPCGRTTSGESGPRWLKTRPGRLGEKNVLHLKQRAEHLRRRKRLKNHTHH